MRNTALKIKDLLEKAAKLGFTKHDFTDLAIIATKRSGASVLSRDHVARALGIVEEPRDHGTKITHLRALAQICRKLGGQLLIVPRSTLSALFNRDWPDEPDEDFDLEKLERQGGYSPAEDGNMEHGQNWRDKIIYAMKGHESIGSIIHEMGHVFADPHPPDSSRCREWRWFGWEMSVARQIGAWETWSRHNNEYGVGADEAWGYLSARKRQAVIGDCIRLAKKIGVVSASGEPRSLR